MYRYVMIGLCLGLVGCASLQMGNQDRRIEAPPGGVFESTVQVLTAYGFEVATADAPRGWIETTSRPVHGVPSAWGRTPEQVRARIDSLAPGQARVQLLITFADDASDAPRKSHPRRRGGLLHQQAGGHPIGQFVDASGAYDDVLDAIETRAEAGR